MTFTSKNTSGQEQPLFFIFVLASWRKLPLELHLYWRCGDLTKTPCCSFVCNYKKRLHIRFYIYIFLTISLVFSGEKPHSRAIGRGKKIFGANLCVYLKCYIKINQVSMFQSLQGPPLQTNEVGNTPRVQEK